MGGDVNPRQEEASHKKTDKSSKLFSLLLELVQRRNADSSARPSCCGVGGTARSAFLSICKKEGRIEEDSLTVPRKEKADFLRKIP